MIEITCNDRLGKKVRIKCNSGMLLLFCCHDQRRVKRKLLLLFMISN